MAAFTDQFTRSNPFEFQDPGTFGAGFARAVERARAVLVGREIAELICIGLALEGLVADQARLAGVRTTQEAWRQSGPAAGDSLELQDWDSNVASFSESEREEQGALGLYEAARAEGQAGPPARATSFEHWEALAVIALWAAVDAVDLLTQGQEAGPIGYEIQPDSHMSVMLPGPGALYDRLVLTQQAAGRAFEAVRAGTLAEEDIERSRARRALTDGGAGAEAVKRLEQAEADRRQRAREASARANEGKSRRMKQHVDEAVRLATSRPFESRIAAAEFAAGRIDSGREDRDLFAISTVDRWLKARNWRAPNIVDPPPDEASE